MDGLFGSSAGSGARGLFRKAMTIITLVLPPRGARKEGKHAVADDGLLLESSRVRLLKDAIGGSFHIDRRRDSNNNNNLMLLSHF